jgi:hypothetical protein
MLAVLFTLACVGGQPALAASFSSSTLGVHESDHAHSVALRSDGDHLDFVLSHGEQDVCDHGAAPHSHDDSAGVSEGGHVVHRR